MIGTGAALACSDADTSGVDKGTLIAANSLQSESSPRSAGFGNRQIVGGDAFAQT